MDNYHQQADECHYKTPKKTHTVQYQNIPMQQLYEEPHVYVRMDKPHNPPPPLPATPPPPRKWNKSIVSDDRESLIILSETPSQVNESAQVINNANAMKLSCIYTNQSIYASAIFVVFSIVLLLSGIATVYLI